jgi:hypothetical protein
VIVLEDRLTLSREIEVAHKAGARLRKACETAGVTVRTLQRWQVRIPVNVTRHSGNVTCNSGERDRGWRCAV